MGRLEELMMNRRLRNEYPGPLIGGPLPEWLKKGKEREHEIRQSLNQQNHELLMKKQDAALRLMLQNALSGDRRSQSVLDARLEEQAARSGYGRDLGRMGANAGYNAQAQRARHNQQLQQLGRQSKLDRERLADQHGYSLEEMALGNQYESRESALERAHRDQMQVRELKQKMDALMRGQEFTQDNARLQHKLGLEEMGIENKHEMDVLNRGQEFTQNNERMRHQLGLEAGEREHEYNTDLERLRGKNALETVLGQASVYTQRDKMNNEFEREMMGLENQYDQQGRAEQELRSNLEMLENAQLDDVNREAVEEWRRAVSEIRGGRGGRAFRNNPAAYSRVLNDLNQKFSEQIQPHLKAKKSNLDRAYENVIPLSVIAEKYGLPGYENSTDVLIMDENGIPNRILNGNSDKAKLKDESANLGEKYEKFLNDYMNSEVIEAIPPGESITGDPIYRKPTREEAVEEWKRRQHETKMLTDPEYRQQIEDRENDPNAARKRQIQQDDSWRRRDIWMEGPGAGPGGPTPEQQRAFIEQLRSRKATERQSQANPDVVQFLDAHRQLATQAGLSTAEYLQTLPPQEREMLERALQQVR